MGNKKNNIKKLVPVKKDGFLLVLQVPQPTTETNRVMQRQVSPEVGQVSSVSEAPGDAKSALDKLKMLAAARMAKSNKS